MPLRKVWAYTRWNLLTRSPVLVACAVGLFIAACAAKRPSRTENLVSAGAVAIAIDLVLASVAVAALRALSLSLLGWLVAAAVIATAGAVFLRAVLNRTETTEAWLHDADAPEVLKLIWWSYTAPRFKDGPLDRETVDSLVNRWTDPTLTSRERAYLRASATAVGELWAVALSEGIVEVDGGDARIEDVHYNHALQNRRAQMLPSALHAV